MGERLGINKIRTLYFFSKLEDLDDFLKTEICEIRITEGETWHKCVASGTTRLLAECTQVDYQNMCIRYYKNVLLFNPHKLAENIQLHVVLPADEA